MQWIKKNLLIGTLKLFKHQSIIILVNVFVLAALATIVFPSHGYTMFTWLDGQYTKHLVEQQRDWAGVFLFGMNFFQGMGDISFGVLFNLVPAHSLASFLFKNTGLDFAVSAYTFFSVQYFVGAYLLCRVFKIPQNVSLLSAWLITLFAFPFLPIYNGQPLLYIIMALSPHVANLLFFSSVLLYIFSFIGQRSLIHTILAGIGFLLVALYILTYSGVGAPVVAPFIIFCCLALTVFSNNRNEFIFKVMVLIFGVLFLVLLKYPQFLLGLLLYSATGFFPDTLTTYPSINYVSILLNFREHIFIAGSYIAAFGLVGSFFVAIKKRTQSSKYALMFLMFSLTLIAFGIISTVFPNWYHGPYSLYYEFILWPLYMGYALTLLSVIFEQLMLFVLFVIRSVTDHKTIVNNVTIFFNGASKTIFLVTATIIAVFTIDLTVKVPPPIFVSSPSISPPPIIQYLKTKLALKPHTVFKGNVATFFPKVMPRTKSGWMDQITFDAIVLLPKLHYPLREELWYNDIPTLLEYNQILSPALYLLSIKTLSRPIDMHIRNIISYTKINVPLLKALGVSHIITNEMITKPETKLLISQFIDDEHGSLYLYELLKPNIGTYSPKKFLPLDNVSTFFDAINKNEVNFSDVVYVSEPVTVKSTSKSKSVVITPIRNGINLTARSSGISTLLLPVLYSHCLHIDFIGKKPDLFKLQRANLVESLITFDKKININIIYQYGLLKYADCRLEDKNELQSILGVSYRA